MPSKSTKLSWTPGCFSKVIKKKRIPSLSYKLKIIEYHTGFCWSIYQNSYESVEGELGWILENVLSPSGRDLKTVWFPKRAENCSQKLSSRKGSSLRAVAKCSVGFSGPPLRQEAPSSSAAAVISRSLLYISRLTVTRSPLAGFSTRHPSFQESSARFMGCVTQGCVTNFLKVERCSGTGLSWLYISALFAKTSLQLIVDGLCDCTFDCEHRLPPVRDNQDAPYGEWQGLPPGVAVGCCSLETFFLREIILRTIWEWLHFISQQSYIEDVLCPRIILTMEETAVIKERKTQPWPTLTFPALELSLME